MSLQFSYVGGAYTIGISFKMDFNVVELPGSSSGEAEKLRHALEKAGFNVKIGPGPGESKSDDLGVRWEIIKKWGKFSPIVSKTIHDEEIESMASDIQTIIKTHAIILDERKPRLTGADLGFLGSPHSDSLIDVPSPSRGCFP